MEIKVKEAILHILDSSATLPIFSQNKLDITQDFLREYIIAHVKKTNDEQQAKEGTFRDVSPFISILKEIQSNFIESSIRIANKLYLIMKKYPNIPNADIIISLLEIESDPYLLMIKLNYRDGLAHYIEYEDDSVSNKLILHKSILPYETRRVEESVLINIANNKCSIIEKKFSLDGEDICYFSDLFLECNTNLSKKESINIINSVAEELTTQYYSNQHEKTSLVRKTIYDCLEDEGTVDVERIADTVFSDREDIRRQYTEKLQEAGVKNRIQFSGKTPEKIANKYRIKTDQGIELSIPMEIFKNKDIIEFINYPNGTYSIVIKQINNLTNK